MKRIASTLLPSACGMLLAAAVFEILLRHLVWSAGLDAPGQSGMLVRRLQEGSAVSHWTSRGIRAAPAMDGPSVLAIGDSFTEAAQVEDDEVFTARLQRMLNVPVLNAGSASRSPADYVVLAPEFINEFQPAWTVIQLNESDLTDDAFVVSKAHFEEGDGQVIAVPARNVRLGRISRLLGRIRGHSALANYAIARIDLYRSASPMPPLFRAGDVEQKTVPAPPRDDPIEAELSALASAYGGRVTFFFIPPLTGEPDAIEQRVIAHCARAGLSCVDFRGAFHEFRRLGRAPFGFANSRFGVGHLNEEGHAAAATLLAQELRTRLRKP